MKRIAAEGGPETLPLKRSLILVPSPVSTVSDNFRIEEDLYSCMEWVKKRERRVVGLLSCALSAGYSPRNRAILVHWMSEFCFDHHLHRETFHLAVNILDRFMSSPGVERLHRGDLQLLGVVALDLSIKYAVRELVSAYHVGTCQGKSSSTTQIIGNHEGGDNFACDSARALVFGEFGVEDRDSYARRRHLAAGKHREAAAE